MRNWIIYSVILLSVSLPLTSFATDATSADCFDVSGWGTSSVNGTYVYYGEVDGNPGFIDDESEIYLRYYGSGPYWFLNDPPASGGTGYYYQDSGVTLDPTTGDVWVVATLGTNPVGTIVRTDCPGGGGGGTASSTLATTTDVSIVADIAYKSLVLFFISLGSSLWIFRSFLA